MHYQNIICCLLVVQLNFDPNNGNLYREGLAYDGYGRPGDRDLIGAAHRRTCSSTVVNNPSVRLLLMTLKKQEFHLVRFPINHKSTSTSRATDYFYHCDKTKTNKSKNRPRCDSCATQSAGRSNISVLSRVGAHALTRQWTKQRLPIF